MKIHSLFFVAVAGLTACSTPVKDDASPQTASPADALIITGVDPKLRTVWRAIFSVDGVKAWS